MRNLVVFTALVALALAIGLVPGLAHRIAGFEPLSDLDPAAIDQPFELDDREAPRFLASRDLVELEVPRDMEVGDLLRLYQIELPHVRRQIAEQEGVATLPDGYRLRAGDVYRIRLTEQAGGIARPATPEKQ